MFSLKYTTTCDTDKDEEWRVHVVYRPQNMIFVGSKSALSAYISATILVYM
jgi:hypothetical protein